MVDELVAECTMIDSHHQSCNSSPLTPENDDSCDEQQFPDKTPSSGCDHKNSVTPTAESSIGLYDVVCGRERLVHTHTGNKWFRKIVQQYREPYQSAGRREEKTRITGEIVSVVEAKGGRFVKFDDEFGIWTEASGSVVHEKVSHALRSAKDPDLVRKRRKHTTESKPASTPEEDKAFQGMLSVQQFLFVELARQERGRDSSHRTAPTDSNRDYVEYLLECIDSL